MVNYKQQNSPVGFPVPIRNVNEIETDSETSAGAAGGGQTAAAPQPHPQHKVKAHGNDYQQGPTNSPFSHSSGGL